MQYAYQSEKLSAARCCLMLPHTQGIPESIVAAFGECHHAFHRLDENQFGDDHATAWVVRIKELMDTTGIADSAEGKWLVKARSLSTDEQFELSRIVDELAHWFDRKFWED